MPFKNKCIQNEKLDFNCRNVLYICILCNGTDRIDAILVEYWNLWVSIQSSDFYYINTKI